MPKTAEEKAQEKQARDEARQRKKEEKQAKKEALKELKQKAKPLLVKHDSKKPWLQHKITSDPIGCLYGGIKLVNAAKDPHFWSLIQTTKDKVNSRKNKLDDCFDIDMSSSLLKPRGGDEKAKLDSVVKGLKIILYNDKTHAIEKKDYQYPFDKAHPNMGKWCGITPRATLFTLLSIFDKERNKILKLLEKEEDEAESSIEESRTKIQNITAALQNDTNEEKQKFGDEMKDARREIDKKIEDFSNEFNAVYDKIKAEIESVSNKAQQGGSPELKEALSDYSREKVLKIIRKLKVQVDKDEKGE